MQVIRTEEIDENSRVYLAIADDGKYIVAYARSCAIEDTKHEAEQSLAAWASVFRRAVEIARKRN